jgi:four helix bundle protein
MAARIYSDLTAWQLADGFKKEVFRLVSASPGARSDPRSRSQLLEAARVVDEDIAEGFLRRSPRDFARFLGFAKGSLAEAELRLRDGISEGHFVADDCREAFQLAKRATVALARLQASQVRYANSHRHGLPRSRGRRT